MRLTDHWIVRCEGRLFARSWQPDDSVVAARGTILLFHDSLGSVAIWRDFPARLAEATGRRVVAYDRLGFGRSDPHPGRLALDFMRSEAIDTVPALVAQLGLGALVPLGHSVGGAMAVLTASHHPQRCVALVTLAAQAFVEDRTRAGILEARRAYHAPDRLERLARHHGDKARWVLDAWTETWLDPAFADWSLDADLAGVGCPLLALHGDRDDYGSSAHPERIARHTGGPSEIVLIEDCGHGPHRDRPEAVLQAVSRFLAPPALREP